MQNALVIGAGGFVGTYLIRHLLELGTYEVSATKIQGEALSIDGTAVYTLDLADRAGIDSLLAKVRPDVIFHLAAVSSVALSWKKPQLVVDVNIKGTLNLLDAVRDSVFSPRMLLIGSGEEYGHVNVENVPICEDTYLRPGNIYAASKAFQGMLGSIYAEAYDMDIVMVRAFNHIGPGQSEIFVVSDFCRQVACIEKGLQEPVIRVGNLAAKRDFTDVRDVVRAYVMLVQEGRAGEFYNVGSGNALAIRDILDIILSKTAHQIAIEVDAEKFRPVDVPIIEADITKLVEETGWGRQYLLETTVEETLDGWRESC